MGAERSLANLIRSLQTASTHDDALRLLPSSTGLLAMLKNPLNLSLLASQLLCADTLWAGDIDLQAPHRILSVFNTAAITVVKYEDSYDPRLPTAQRRGLEREAWTKAVVNGADAKSPRWRHLLLLGGILLGFEGQNRASLPLHLKNKLESALVKALQLALEELDQSPKIAGYTIALVLTYTFDLLSDWQRSKIAFDLLLPVLVDGAFFSSEGLDSGYFLGIIDQDVREVPGKKFAWAEQSPTYRKVSNILSKPLVSSLGPLSRLIAQAVENVQDQGLVLQTTNQLLDFSRTLAVQWRQNKLSEVDPSEDAEFLDQNSLQTTIPTLWRLLRISIFSIVIVLRAVLGRVLNDPILGSDKYAPSLAVNSLHTLRNLCFISGRIGQNASSQYVFVNLTAIDILSQYPDLSEKFLEAIKPTESGQIPAHPAERCLDLFFLNTAEHFTLVLSPEVNERLLISAALPYLASGGNNNLLEIFEAAHSVVLAVLAAPKSADMAAQHLPYYVSTLFDVFPQNLSARQFRLAFKTILQITAPPSPLANSQPLLPSTLLQLLYDRAVSAPTTPLPQPTIITSTTDPSSALSNPPPSLSEQAVLTLTIIDCLCFLRIDVLDEWLPITAKLINMISDKAMRKVCVERFWDALSSGEMDVERANFCVMWWSTRGGREMVLFGEEQDQDQKSHELQQEPYMSGALVEGGGRESKL
ncbi:hypothetical protein VTO42DRAFT_9026 [Malbranchea cinnamomea]